MKIALLGYGKMGKVIETIALNRGHEISLKVDKYSIDYDLSSVDVAINFSTPKSAVENISKALESNVPVISGTTGWLSELETIETLCNKKEGAFIYASNFSLGVNIFFELNKVLAKGRRLLVYGGHWLDHRSQLYCVRTAFKRGDNRDV
jgi:4-hydroxy-tetrahydrodipicolinate reductase